MEEEAAKLRAKQQLDTLEAASKPPAENATKDNSEDIIRIPTEDIITPLGASPNTQCAPPPPKDTQPDESMSPDAKKKNRNALQRFIRAMRKRLHRNRSPAEANRTTT